MRKILSTVGAAASVAIAMGSAAGAQAAAGDPVLQRFKLDIVNQSSRVLATGPIVSGQGTAVETGPASVELSFPGAGPATLTVHPTTVVSSTSAGCLERMSQSGTFTFFGFNPPGTTVAFGGDGTFVSSSVTLYRRLPGGGCATTAPPLVRHVTLDAGATRLFAVA